MAIDKPVMAVGEIDIEEVDNLLEDADEIMQGLDGISDDDESIVELEDGGVEIYVDGLQDTSALADAPFDANLAELMDDDILAEIAGELMEEVDSDIAGRSEWVNTYVEGLKVLGFNYEERTEPWQGACGVYSNVLAEAAIRFQAETMSETFPSTGPVRTKILGEETKDKREAASRVEKDMNYELTERMVEYRSEHERLLYGLGLAGSAFKKIYFDPTTNRQKAMFVNAEDVIVPYGESQLEATERVTHIMRKTPNEFKKLQVQGFYRDIDLGDPEPYVSDIEEAKAKEAGFEPNEDNRHTFYELHVDYDVENDVDGVAKPYVITIDRSSGEVLSIYRNWKEDDPLFAKRQHFTHYVYVPAFGFYGMGLIHIIGGYARAGTSIIRQLVDAGTLSNLPGGLKAKGLRIKNDDEPIAPGEFKDVDVLSGTIRDNILPLPYKEPSQTLLLLLEKITNEGRRLGAISEMNISDMSANAPVGTTLALLERTLKPMAAVQARVHAAMKQEFKLLKGLIAEHAPDDYSYQPDRGDINARAADYDMVDIIPVSDPNNSTMAQRIVQHQAALQMARDAPQIYNLAELHRGMLDTLGIPNADKIIPLSEDILPADPVSENMSVLVGKPVKAYIQQDHEAHIKAHAAFMQDPMIMGAIGQNPQAQQIMAALQAHMAEHLAFRYRNQIEKKLGAPLPAPNTELPDEIELQLSRLVADAGQQLTQGHKQEAAAQQAQQQAQDPIMQLRQAEQKLKGAEQARKAAKDADEAEQRRLDREVNQRQESMRILLEGKRVELEQMKVQNSNKSQNRKDDLAELDLTERLAIELERLNQPQKVGKEE